MCVCVCVCVCVYIYIYICFTVSLYTLHRFVIPRSIFDEVSTMQVVIEKIMVSTQLFDEQSYV